jgi:hypothetical protein
MRIAVTLVLLAAAATAHSEVYQYGPDLLIIGGTESGCAAAIQAARMGVKSIAIVNDTEWLGGQFSSEALASIDENRGPDGYGHGVPFPRNGLFKETIERIEAINEVTYGEPRPGNTRCITTGRPRESAKVFQDMLAPYIATRQVRVYSNSQLTKVNLGSLVLADVVSESGENRGFSPRLVIDATDWGDVVKLAGADYEYGPDLKSTYGEPLAPESREGYPLTDMNPITYCMSIEETDDYTPIPKPDGYDPRNYRDHGYPKDPLWLYPTRRLVDRYNFEKVTHPDVLLLCFPAFDYPVDVWTKKVADALEATEAGASKKDIATLTPQQRQIVFEDAKLRSLGFLYYLQTEVHDAMEDTTHSFRRFQLSDEFGTPDNLPFKPYIRESLRTKCMYMMRQQDTTGYGGQSTNFANVMYHDTVASWQFEYDFHPTRRHFLEGDPAGPWHSKFRNDRTWGPPYSGRSTFPIRSMIPEKVDGLLVAQKNLGYSSLVSAALRLHDQSMAVGQAVGAVAAVSLLNDVPPREIPYNRALISNVQEGLCARLDGGQPATLWPFGDLDPEHPAFVAVNMLGVRGCLPHTPDTVDFRPDEPADAQWREYVLSRSLALKQYTDFPLIPLGKLTRGEFARRWWKSIKTLPDVPYTRVAQDDADADGILDKDDALLFSKSTSSWPEYKPRTDKDGNPDPLAAGTVVKQFNFTGASAPGVEGYYQDSGAVFNEERGYGWKESLLGSTRIRGRMPEPWRDGFVFTRSHAVWECNLPNGTYSVTVCIGDSGHSQQGQNVSLEGKYVLEDVYTTTGEFVETTAQTTVTDGGLTMAIGKPGATTNTCINWIRVVFP